MKEKSESKQIDHVMKMLEQEEKMVKSEVEKFYPDDILAHFSFSSEKAPLAPLLTKAKEPPAPQTPTQAKMKEICLQIRDNVKQGKQGNVEIQLNKGRQLSDKQAFPLGNTVIKVLPLDADKPEYLFIKSGYTLDATIFLGYDSVQGIMVIQDENGDDNFLRLSEFHLLSLRDDPNPHKEIGLMTSYVWLTAKVFTSILFASSLDPVKSLLLSEWLLAEWQRAKEALLDCNTEVTGGSAHE